MSNEIDLLKCLLECRSGLTWLLTIENNTKVREAIELTINQVDNNIQTIQNKLF